MRANPPCHADARSEKKRREARLSSKCGVEMYSEHTEAAYLTFGALFVYKAKGGLLSGWPRTRGEASLPCHPRDD